MHPHLYSEMGRLNSAELDRAAARRQHEPHRARAQRDENLQATGRFSFRIARILTAVVPTR